MEPESKVLALFFENPSREFYLREVGVRAKISVGAAKKYLDKLAKAGILSARRQGNMRLFRANRESPAYKQKKVAYTVERIVSSGLLDALMRFKPSSIVLYGSFARGEDDEKSDIDILVISESKTLPRLPSLFGREVNVLVYGEREWARKAKENKAFYDQVIIHGIPLYGKKPVVA